jgi:hypothetical protein
VALKLLYVAVLGISYAARVQQGNSVVTRLVSAWGCDARRADSLQIDATLRYRGQGAPVPKVGEPACDALARIDRVVPYVIVQDRRIARINRTVSFEASRDTLNQTWVVTLLLWNAQ